MRDAVVSIIRNPWWAIVGLAFTLGATVSAFKAHETAQDLRLNAKADSAQVERLTQSVNRLDDRLRDFICDGKPRYCQ